MGRAISAMHGRRGMIGFYFARSVPGVLNLFLVCVLGLKLSHQGYVEFSIWLGLTVSAGFMFFGWIGQSIARHANGSDDLLSECPRVFIGAALASCLVVFSVATISFHGRRHDANWPLILLGCCSCCFNGYFTTLSAALQARMRLAGYVTVEACRPLGSTLGALLAVFLISSSATHAALGFVAGQTVACLGILVWLRTDFSKVIFSQMRALAVGRSFFTIAKYGLPISLWLALNSAWPACDRSLLGLFFSPQEVGRYSLRYDLVVRGFTFLLLPLTLYSQPKIFSAFGRGDLTEVRGQIWSSLKWQGAVGLICTLLLAASAPFLTERFSRLSGVSASEILLLGATASAWQMALMCQKWLECYKRVWLMVGLLITSYGVIGCGIGLIVVPVMGVDAFLFGSLCGGLVYCSVCFSWGLIMVKGKNVNQAALQA